MPLRRNLLLAALSLALAGGAGAQTYDRILEVRESTHLAAAASQERIDQLSDETRTLLARYQSASRQADSLRVYVEQLDKLVASQETEKRELQQQIDGVSEVERDIMPLMQQMVDVLAQFVEADVPFLLSERRSRVERMRELLVRSDVTVAEKYRRLLEAYQIENTFGHTIEAYAGDLERDGNAREVDFLRIGRVALFYQTRDGEESGTWTQDGWQTIDDGYASAIRQGLRIANRQAAPDLLLLPLPAAPPLAAPAATGAGR
jgi:chromosome segregation ATPase